MGTKKCPFCAEAILDEAIKCRYCGEFLSNKTTDVKPSEPTPESTEIKKPFTDRKTFALLGIVIIVGAILWVSDFSWRRKLVINTNESQGTGLTTTANVSAYVDSERKRLTCMSIQDYGYSAGYDGGQSDKERGEKFEPEVHYSLPDIQAVLLVVKEKVKSIAGDQKLFDECCKEGFMDGYSDGYQNKPKRPPKLNL